MTSYALVEESGRVAQVETKGFDVALPLKWVKCGAEVAPEWQYVNGGFEYPTRPEEVPAVLMVEAG